jgi:hypothetical protein
LTAADPLAPWLQLQALYAQQIDQLGRAHPDLALLGGLAARADQLLRALMRAQEQRPPEAPERLQVKAAAAAAAAMLARARILLERLRARQRELARQRERATRAAQVYRAKGMAQAPRFLDLRR